jgi:hypothetical protein
MTIVLHVTSQSTDYRIFIFIALSLITPGLIYLVKDNDPDKEFNQR